MDQDNNLANIISNEASFNVNNINYIALIN